MGDQARKPRAVDRALATLAEDKALQSAIDARDVQTVARLVVAGSSTQIRQAAAHAVEDPEVLRQLIRDVRGGNDKSVYKILTAKRDGLLEEARQLAQLRAKIEAASGALERHSQRSYDALYIERLAEYERGWTEVAAQADAGLRGRVQQWIDRSRETVAEHLRQVAVAAAQQQAAADQAAEARRLREQRAQADAAAAAEQARVRDEKRRELADKQRAEQLAARQMAELIGKARAALSGGSTSRAAAVRRTIDEKMLAGAQPLPANLASQLQQLDKQLAELKDWKSFSVAPKRAELIEEMESLVGIELEPMALADKITSLKDAWRTLRKGADENIEADSQRFLAAAQKAYQPCSEYFAAQALVREENLRRREVVLAELLAFDAAQNWEQPDWPIVIKTLREKKQAWRNCQPVDRQAGQRQQEQFVAIAASLQSRLDAEYSRNQKQKESLIERAQQLTVSEDARKAIDAVKALQQQWRTVGLVPRAMDQRLWGEFRQHCDAVFQKREQEFAAYTVELENNKSQAVAYCERLEKIATLEGAELLERAGERSELRTAFKALGEFPRAEARELRARFEQGLDRCEAAVARQHARNAERSWSDLFDAANQIRAYRLAVALGLDKEQIDGLKAAVESCMASVPKWPKHGLDGLQQALASERSEDLAANEAALKMLCIRAEILTDTPTPTDDQGLRREYQLQRLVQGMGQGAKDDETDLDTLAIEWAGVGPVEEAVYQPLVQRFRRCRDVG